MVPVGPVVDLVRRYGSWLVSGAGVLPEEVAAVSLVDGMGEVMGMFCVLVDKDGLKDVLEAKVVWKGELIGMVDIVVSPELEDPRRWGISPVGPVGGVVSPGARDGGLTDGVTDERRWGISPISPEDVVAVSLVDGMGEVMGMFCVLADEDGVKDVLEAKVVWKGVLRGEGMLNMVVSSGPEGVEAVSLVDGMGEVMVGMFWVLVDMDGVKDVSVGNKDGIVKGVLGGPVGARVVWKGVLIGEGMVNIVVSAGPVGTGPGPVGGGPEGLVPGPAVGLSVGLGGGVVSTMSMGPLGPPVGGRGVEVLLLHLQNFFLGKHFSAGLSSGLSGVGLPSGISTSIVTPLPYPVTSIGCSSVKEAVVISMGSSPSPPIAIGSSPSPYPPIVTGSSPPSIAIGSSPPYPLPMVTGSSPPP